MIKYVFLLCCISFVFAFKSVENVQVDSNFFPEVELVWWEMNESDALWTLQKLQTLLFEHGEDLSARGTIFWQLNSELKSRFADGNNWNVYSFSEISHTGRDYKLNWYISGKYAILKTKNYYLEVHVPATTGGKPN